MKNRVISLNSKHSQKRKSLNLKPWTRSWQKTAGPPFFHKIIYIQSTESSFSLSLSRSGWERNMVTRGEIPKSPLEDARMVWLSNSYLYSSLVTLFWIKPKLRKPNNGSLKFRVSQLVLTSIHLLVSPFQLDYLLGVEISYLKSGDEFEERKFYSVEFRTKLEFY